MSKNRARDRAARAAMQETGAFRARAVRQVDTTGKNREYPVRLVDAHGASWYLNSGETNAYGTRALHYSETRTYEQIVTEAGPVRHIDVPADGDSDAIRQALRQAGPKALATLTTALHVAATACEHATGRPEDLVAGRPGSTESAIVLGLALDAGPEVPAASVDTAALEAVAEVLTRWVTGETVVELAENLAWTVGPVVDELGWLGITDPWARRHLAPYANWVTGHSQNRVGTLRARAVAELFDEDDAEPPAVGQVAFLLDASVPVEPDADLIGDATMEHLLAALVARNLHTLERDGTEYPARADVFVLPPASDTPEVLVKQPGLQVNRPGDAAPGWRNVSALVLVSTRRPWGLYDEDQRVITDAYRTAAAALNRHWPGLPEEYQHAALSLDMMAALRGQFGNSAVRDLFADLIKGAVHHAYTQGADPELEPSAGEHP
ncbi:hypothetical protein [Streptomyces sp. AC1-42T]|uniref:hypothetical protein n=1 Tax=Streptomyces sp. AC1-42T TaxID=2218665 RepID=UPI000DAE6EFD|nr:hypothetical protein [Streptomyces sp. AC1-42T]